MQSPRLQTFQRILFGVQVITHTVEPIADPWKKQHVIETFYTIPFVNRTSEPQLNSILNFQ